MLWVSLAASSRSACSCVQGACTLAQVPLAWSCVFVAVNAANASAIAADRWPGTLTPEEVELHQRHFNKLTPGEFKQLLDLAERRTLPHGQELTRESVHAPRAARPCSTAPAARPLLTRRAPLHPTLHPSPSPHLGQEPCDQLYYIVSGRCKLYLRNVRRSKIASRSRDRNPNSGPNTDPWTALWTPPLNRTLHRAWRAFHKCARTQAYAADVDAGGFVNDVAFQQGEGAGVQTADCRLRAARAPPSPSPPHIARARSQIDCRSCPRRQPALTPSRAHVLSLNLALATRSSSLPPLARRVRHHPRGEPRGLRGSRVAA